MLRWAPQVSSSAWGRTEEEKQAALARLRLRRVDMESLPQGPSKAILLYALDDVIAEIVFGERKMTARRVGRFGEPD
jgi:hypothetical protein